MGISDRFFSQFLRWPLSSQLKFFRFCCFGCVCAAKMVVLLDCIYATRTFRWNSLLVCCNFSLFTAMLSALSGSTLSRSNSRWISSFNIFVINRSPILSSRVFQVCSSHQPLFRYCWINRRFQFFSVFAGRKRRPRIIEKWCCEVGWRQFLAISKIWVLTDRGQDHEEIFLLVFFVPLWIFCDIVEIRILIT